VPWEYYDRICIHHTRFGKSGVSSESGVHTSEAISSVGLVLQIESRVRESAPALLAWAVAVFVVA
jgi:hypothetical protein